MKPLCNHRRWMSFAIHEGFVALALGDRKVGQRPALGRRRAAKTDAGEETADMHWHRTRDVVQ
jgi:hypothetical protein